MDNGYKVELNMYDKEETFYHCTVETEDETIYPCTVQVLTNTKTGEVSVGWWREKGD